MSATVAVRGCAPEDVGIEFTDDAPADLRDTITAYLARFDAPIMVRSTLRCECGAALSGILGAFTWGLVHGEGFCGSCRRPARAYHFIREQDKPQGESLIEFPFVLLYAAAPSPSAQTETGR